MEKASAGGITEYDMTAFLRNQTVKTWEKQIRKKFGNGKGMCGIWECT